jgi:hypothetical protein
MAKEPINPSSKDTLQELLDKKFELEGIKLKANIKEEIAKEITSEVHGNTLWLQAGLAFLGIIVAPSALFYIKNSISAAVEQNSSILMNKINQYTEKNAKNLKALSSATQTDIDQLNKKNKLLKQTIENEFLLLRLSNDIIALKDTEDISFSAVKIIMFDLKTIANNPFIIRNRAFPSILHNLLFEFTRTHLAFDIQETYNLFKPVILHDRNIIKLLLNYYTHKRLISGSKEHSENLENERTTNDSLLTAAEKFSLFDVSIPSRMLIAYHMKEGKQKIHALFKIADHLSNEKKAKLLWYIMNNMDAHFSKTAPMPMDYHTAEIIHNFVYKYQTEWLHFASAPGLINAVQYLIRQKSQTPEHIKQERFMMKFLYKKNI